MSKRKRNYIPLKVQLAAALCQLGGIPYADAKALTVDQVRSLFILDHYPKPHALGGTDDHFNLQWLFVPGSKLKTAKVDMPAITKVKRGLKKREREATAKAAFDLGARDAVVPRWRQKKKGRPMAGSKTSKFKRKLNGRTELRTP